MKQYLEALNEVKTRGNLRTDRTGTGTKSIFGYQMKFDLSEGFPATTTKKLAFNMVLHELLWFLQGSSNIKYLVDNNVNIWNEWPYKAYLQSTGQPVPHSSSDEWKQGIAKFVEQIKTDDEFAAKYGELGPVYGYQWRHWPNGKGGEIDQIQRTVDMIKKTPDSRRIIVSAWNVADIDEMAIAGLPPCHTMFQFYVNGDKLDCQLYQRSADLFLGVPFNIASYALLTMMMAQATSLKPGVFTHSFGDMHIYTNHEDQVNLQLSRTPKKLPTLWINPGVTDIFKFTFNDFKLLDYDPDEPIKAPIAV